MPLSAAEKQRRYRERLKENAELYEDYLQKERNRWQERKQSGKLKQISDMTKREQRQKRRRWKEQQRKCREKKLAFDETTPPPTPVGPTPGPSRQAVEGRKVRRRKLAQLHYRLKRAQQDVHRSRRQAERFKKRWQRAIQKQSESVIGQCMETPRSKTRRLLRTACTSSVRKTLIFHHALVDQMKARYQETVEERHKQMYSRLVCGNILKRYRFQRLAQQSLGFSAKRWKLRNTEQLTRKKYKSVAVLCSNAVSEFFERDDVSRITSGKKQTVTFKKQKKQKRFLNDTLKNLYEKFMAENSSIKLSFTVFCRLKPFWVCKALLTDRETCLCKLHENLQFLATQMKDIKALATDNLEHLVSEIACDINAKECMYLQCATCKDARNTVHLTDVNELCHWNQWKTVKEKREIKKGGKTEEKEVTMTVKATERGTCGDLCDLFHEQMSKFRIHFFNIRHQYKQYQKLRREMSVNEVLVHIDFAENYVAKLSSSIQSAHFGASQRQITLHTGVFYVGPSSDAHTFCSVSDSLQHGPVAVWTHLLPVLDDILSTHENIDMIHFFSDGPTAQYRQKVNFLSLQTFWPRKEFTKQLGTFWRQATVKVYLMVWERQSKELRMRRCWQEVI